MARENQAAQEPAKRSGKPKKDTWFSRFLERLTAANERQFGGQVPDCCGKPRTARNTTVDRSKAGR